MNTTIKVLGGFLLGTAIGTATGILIAPSSGRKTRKMLKEKSNDYVKHAKSSVNDYLDGLKKEYNTKLDEYAKNGKSSIDSLKNTIKA